MPAWAWRGAADAPQTPMDHPARRCPGLGDRLLPLRRPARGAEPPLPLRRRRARLARGDPARDPVRVRARGRASRRGRTANWSARSSNPAPTSSRSTGTRAPSRFPDPDRPPSAHRALARDPTGRSRPNVQPDAASCSRRSGGTPTSTSRGRSRRRSGTCASRPDPDGPIRSLGVACPSAARGRAAEWQHTDRRCCAHGGASDRRGTGGPRRRGARGPRRRGGRRRCRRGARGRRRRGVAQRLGTVAGRPGRPSRAGPLDGRRGTAGPPPCRREARRPGPGHRPARPRIVPRARDARRRGARRTRSWPGRARSTGGRCWSVPRTSRSLAGTIAAGSNAEAPPPRRARAAGARAARDDARGRGLPADGTQPRACDDRPPDAGAVLGPGADGDRGAGRVGGPRRADRRRSPTSRS